MDTIAYVCFVDCGDPSPLHGTAITSNGTTAGSTAFISCSEGYNMSGSSTITCTSDGWDSLPTCSIQGMYTFVCLH